MHQDWGTDGIHICAVCALCVQMPRSWVETPQHPSGFLQGMNVEVCAPHPPTSATSATVSSTTSVSSGRASCCCWEEKMGFREVRAKASFASEVPPAGRARRAAHWRSPRLCLRDYHGWGGEGKREAEHRGPIELWSTPLPLYILYLRHLSKI